MYFDSHAHLTEDCFAQDFSTIVDNMKAAGVTAMMEIGYDEPSSRQAAALAEKYDWVWAAVGSHPDDAARVDEARIEEYRMRCKNPRVKAIGEIGLDYHYDLSPRDTQRAVFERQLDLAMDLGMPVQLHIREAHGECMDLLRSRAAAGTMPLARRILPYLPESS